MNVYMKARNRCIYKPVSAQCTITVADNDTNWQFLTDLLGELHDKNLHALITCQQEDSQLTVSTQVSTFIQSIRNYLKLPKCMRWCLYNENQLRGIAVPDQPFDLIVILEITRDSPPVLRLPGDKGGKFALTDGVASIAEKIEQWLDELLSREEVWGCLLIGGKSSRMGSPKHLLQSATGVTWGEKIAELFSATLDGVVIAGNGDLPNTMRDFPRLQDVNGGTGPLSGVLSALRWNPSVSWIVAACDMPYIHSEAVDWLLGQKKAGDWGVIPSQGKGDRLEPLFAYYHRNSRFIFEELLYSQCMKISKVAENSKMKTILLPGKLADYWVNCNTPQDLEKLRHMR